MAYNIEYSNSTLKPTPIVVNDNQVDNTSTSLVFVGRGRQLYGEALQRNFLQLLENFASPIEPATPTVGQSWYDSSEGKLKVYTTTGWVRLQIAGNPGPVAPSNPTLGMTWFDTTEQMMKYWDGAQWLPFSVGNVAVNAADSAPSNPGIGDLWYDTLNLELMAWTGTQWQEINSQATLSENLNGGDTGSVPYQTNTNETSFLPIGSANRVMVSTGSAPQWANTLQGLLSVSATTFTSTVTTGTAPFTIASTSKVDNLNADMIDGVHISSPIQGGVVYAVSNNTINTTAVGQPGQVLVSNGTGAPTWENYAGESGPLIYSLVFGG